MAGKDGLMLMLTDRVDDELLDAAGPQLRVVADYAVGIDNIDVEACRRRGVVVSNTPDVLTETTAELTLALMLALLRRVAEGDRLIRRGEQWIWAPNLMLGRGLAGLTLGLVGYGRIGQAVERLARAHGMDVVHTLAQRRPARSTSCSPPPTSSRCTCPSPLRWDFTRRTSLRAYSAFWLSKKTPTLEPTSVGRYRQRIAPCEAAHG